MASEPTFGINEFGENEILTGDQTAIRQILHLMIMEKDTDPLNPDKGIGINSYKWNRDTESTLSEIQREVDKQLSTYTTYTPSSIAVRVIQKNIMLLMALDKVESLVLFTSDGTTANSQLSLFKET